jgi:hypothetical protein
VEHQVVVGMVLLLMQQWVLEQRACWLAVGVELEATATPLQVTQVERLLLAVIQAVVVVLEMAPTPLVVEVAAQGSLQMALMEAITQELQVAQVVLAVAVAVLVVVENIPTNTA